MATQRNRKRSLSRVAGIGAALGSLALVGTVVTAAPAFAGPSKTPTTVTLSSSNASALVTGAPVTFTATVGAAATGTIAFTVTGSDGTTANCQGGNTQPISAMTANCAFPGGLLGKPLYYTVTATLHDPHFTAPEATLIQQIGKSLTTTSLSSMPGSVVASEPLAFTATVTDVAPGTGSPTGSMEFAFCPVNQPTCSGGPGGAYVMPAPTPAEEAANDNKIKFSLPSGVLRPGFYSVSADYVGDSNYWSSQSSFSYILVTKVPTTLGLVASDNPTYNAGREILRAVVKADTRATQSLGGPSGTVTYTITGASGDTLVCQETGTDVIQIGLKPADQGVARCTISGAVLSTDSPYSITAVYSGNSVYDGSSGSGSVTVINNPS